MGSAKFKGNISSIIDGENIKEEPSSYNINAADMDLEEDRSDLKSGSCESPDSSCLSRDIKFILQDDDFVELPEIIEEE